MEATVNSVPELVDLPDAAVTPLVHPLDVPDARRPFLISWLISAATGPAAVLGLVVLLWAVARPVVVAPLAGAVVLAAGAAATRWYSREAWAFIPRNRQDRGRLLLLRWELARSVILAASVGAAMCLVARRLRELGVSEPVSAYVVGAYAGIAVAIAAEGLWRLATPARRRAGLRPVLLGLPGFAAVGAATLYAGGLLARHGGWRAADVAAGAAILIVAQLVVWVLEARSARGGRHGG
jgi:hypothetical protein